MTSVSTSITTAGLALTRHTDSCWHEEDGDQILKTLRLTCWGLAALVIVRPGMQSFPQVGPAAQNARVAGASVWRQSAVHFSDSKPVLGLPPQGSRSVTHCSNDGTTFIDLYTDSSLSGSQAAPELFSISPGGEAKYLRRKMPLNFTSISVRDFFAGDQMLVTLLEAVKRDDRDETASGEISYFLSISDHDGGGADLLPLDLRFRPLKVATFGAGYFLVLGWDEINLMPLLVLLKDDGTILRFVDLDERPHYSEPYISYWSMKEAEASERVRVTVASLQRAQFVPYGSQVLLAFPGTAKSVRLLSPIGEDRPIPIEMPAGFVLHDVLVSGARYPLVLRAQPIQDSGKPATAGETSNPPQRLFEMSARNGSLLREFAFDKPRIDAVTCAAATSLTAIFPDTIANPAPPAAGVGDPTAATERVTQVVIATAPR